MIKLLDEATIQKIAAGEVIERPSSIVKELFENSIDASAKNIQITIEKGGKSLISIIDDGLGISHDQVEMAFIRHATSKINNFDDLYKNYNMGFRGEALASIVAVSEVDMKTKTESESLGTHIIYKNSRVQSKKPVAMNTGTIINIRDIFDNVPVRKKFLKSDITEANHITDLVSKLSLANPELSIKYTKDDRIIFNINSVDSHVEKVRKIFGNDLANSLRKFSITNDRFKVFGYVSDNTYFRGNRSLQYTYVNNRYIESKEISSAIEIAYQHVIPNGKYPAYQIYIETNPNNLDVNIHPNKTKVHFNYIEELTDLLKNSISELFRPENIKQVGLSNRYEKEKLLFDLDKSGDKYVDLLDRYKDTKSNIRESQVNYLGSLDISDEVVVDEVCVNETNGSEKVLENKKNFHEINSNIQVPELINFEVIEDTLLSKLNSNSEDNEYARIFEDFIYLTDIFSTYLIFENLVEGKAIIVDQHAAHERINYEKLMAIYYEEDNPSQILLDPLSINFIEAEIDCIFNNQELIKRFGFDFNINDKTILIEKVPALQDFNHKSLFLDIVDGLINNSEFKSTYLMETIIKKACKSSIKAYDKISSLEAQDLLIELEKCEYPFTCPHGRPTYISVDKKQLDIEFKRIK